MRRRVWVLLAAAMLPLEGCTVGPNYQPPKMDLPSEFATGAAAQPATGASTQAARPPVDITHWWRSLNDAELDSLIDRAVAANPDVSVALTRLQQARATEFVISGGVLPYIEGSGTAGRGTGTNSTKGRISPPLNAATNTTGLKEITQVVGFDAGWEIDLFGRFRRQLEAAGADRQAAAEARNAVIITVVSDVARAYIDMRTAQERLAIAQENITVAKQTLDLVQQRFDRGLTNELDVALAKRQIAIEQAAVAPLETAARQGQRRLAVLLGQSPESLYAELAPPPQPPKPAAALPDPPVKVVTGVPVDLLRRRPDIREAERELAAQNARIGVATADLFPRVAVTAGYGLQGQGLGRNPMTNSMIWSAGPTAVVPLLDFGRIDSMIEVQDYLTRERFFEYQRTVLGAIEEVDDAAANYAAERNRLENLNDALVASKRAVDLASGRYERGLIDFLNVLDAQRQLYELQDQLTVSQQAVVTEYIAVYKALGGGWEPFQNVPDIRKPLPAIIAAGEHITQNP